MINCVFCSIAAGDAAAAVVYQDERAVAFLDIRPLFAGHVLLAPKSHVATLPDLDAAAVGPLFATAQLLCRAVEEAMDADGSFVAINNRVSQSVPHLHVHVVPRKKKDGLRGFFWPRTSYRDGSHVEEVRRSIAEAANRLKASGQ